MPARRLLPSPALVVAGVALLFALAGSAFAVGQQTAAPQPKCKDGAVRALAVVTGVPGRGIENIPDTYTTDRQAFGRKFNCTGKAVQVKRAGAGSWDVRFIGISGASCVASSMSASAGSISCVPQPDGGYRVTLRGVVTDNNALPPMNVPFLVVVI
jgi:hypothetical protein